MRGVLDVLGGEPEETAGRTGAASDDSLWPSLSRQLPALARGTSPSADFNGWYPAVAVAAVCLLIVTSAREAPPPPVPASGVELGPVWPVGTVVAPDPIRLPPAGQTDRPPADPWIAPNRPAPHPFDDRQDGTHYGGPRDPMMIYAGDR
jgi:hypothetical protein